MDPPRTLDSCENNKNHMTDDRNCKKTSDNRINAQVIKLLLIGGVSNN